MLYAVTFFNMHRPVSPFARFIIALYPINSLLMSEGFELRFVFNMKSIYHVQVCSRNNTASSARLLGGFVPNTSSR